MHSHTLTCLRVSLVLFASSAFSPADGYGQLLCSCSHVFRMVALCFDKGRRWRRGGANPSGEPSLPSPAAPVWGKLDSSSSPSGRVAVPSSPHPPSAANAGRHIPASAPTPRKLLPDGRGQVEPTRLSCLTAREHDGDGAGVSLVDSCSRSCGVPTGFADDKRPPVASSTSPGDAPPARNERAFV